MTRTDTLSQSEIVLLKENIKFLQSGHSPVVQVKRKMIEDLLTQFLLHQIAKERGRAGTPDFGAYLRDLSPKLPELAPDLLKDALRLGTDAPLREVLGMADFKYIPPQDPTGLINDLCRLHTYWNIWPASRMLLSEEVLNRVLEGDCSQVFQEPFEGFDEFLDLSLVKLSFKVALEISGIRQWGKKKEAMVRKNLERKRHAETRRGVILTQFANIKKEAGDSLNLIANRIYNTLKKTGLPEIPSKKTIERDIKENHLLMKKCFSKEQRGKSIRFIFRHTGV